MIRLVCVACILAACWADGAVASGPVVKVKVCRIKGAPSFSDRQADTFLERCNRIMADSTCPVRFERDGSVTEMDGPATLTPENFHAFSRSEPYRDCNVRIFRFIDGCGRTPGLQAGCSDVDVGRMSINVTLQPEFNAQMWLHEFGHNCGLGHIVDEANIMYWRLGPERLGVLSKQCKLYTEVAEKPAAVADRAARQAAVMAAMAPQGRPRQPVEEFVRGTFPHGVPFEEANRYGVADLETLIKMLDATELRASRPSIVTTMCYIGDRSAVRPLLTYFERGEAVITDAELTAKANVLLHLGDLINLSDDSEPVKFLADSLSRSGAWERGIPWTLADDEGNKIRNELLARNAVSGLGLSGVQAALDKLSVIEDVARDATMRSHAQKAKRIFREVKAKGLKAYRIELDRSTGHVAPLAPA